MKKILFAVFLLGVMSLHAQSDFHQWLSAPPMVWSNTSNEITDNTEFDIKKGVDFIAANNLLDLGWKYVVVGERWYAGKNPQNPAEIKYSIDKNGRFLPSETRFPTSIDSVQFKAFSYYLHEKGLKFGLRITRGVPIEAVHKKSPIAGSEHCVSQIHSWHKTSEDTYAILPDKPGAQEYYNSVFKLYAGWAVDFVQIEGLLEPYQEKEIEMFRQAIDSCGRKIILCLSSGSAPVADAEHVSSHANLWNVGTRSKDYHLADLMEVYSRWIPFSKQGTYPYITTSEIDGLFDDEILSLITFHYISKSPWIMGLDLSRFDKEKIALFKSDYSREILKYSKDNKQIRLDEQAAIWVAGDSRSSIKYLAVFNLSSDNSPAKIAIDLKDLGVSGSCKIIDVWKGKDLGIISKQFTPEINYHGAGLYKVISDYRF